jgi:hypothetical protein
MRESMADQRRRDNSRGAHAGGNGELRGIFAAVALFVGLGWFTASRVESVPDPAAG